MFLNPSITLNTKVSQVILTTENNDLYENGVRIATTADINPNVLITDNPLITPQAGAVILSDGLTPFGTISDNDLKYEVIAGENILSVGAAQVISANNNMKLETTDYILTTKDIYLQGTADVQRYLTIGCTNQVNNVKTSVDITTNDYVCDNQLATKTQWKGASEYNFDNDVKIGDALTTKKLYVNDVEITPSAGSVSAGMLRALNINQIVPTVAQTYNIVWSSLSPAEQAIWAGGSEPPTASATGNYWNFTKSAPSTNKINWTLPIDLSALTFQDMQSVWAIVRFNNGTNVSTEGALWFQIQSQNIVPDPPLYRTRWNYSNSATPVNQFQYFYKIHALDTITTTTAANLGKGQEVGQQKFKGNPCDVESNLWNIGFSKFVMSPTGDTSAGYTLAPVQTVALNTASNIHTYNFDVVAIGINNYRWNLFYA